MYHLLLLLLSIPTYRSAVLAWERFSTGTGCPSVAAVPACYIVFVGYGVMLVSALLLRSPRTRGPARVGFGVGAIAPLVLAFFGTVLNLIRGDVCPKGPADIPLCYLSLAVLIACIFVFRRVLRTLPASK